MESFMNDIKGCVKKENIRFLLKFLDEAMKCGELTEIGVERIKGNKGLREFFDEGRDEMVETLEDTVRGLATLKKKIKGDGSNTFLRTMVKTPTKDYWKNAQMISSRYLNSEVSRRDTPSRQTVKEQDTTRMT